MSELNLNWKPDFGTIYTWFAMDKNGYIAVMINNNWGDIPKCLLSIDNIEHSLDALTDFLWEKPKSKKSDFGVDLYSYWNNKDCSDKFCLKERLEKDFSERESFSDVNIPVNNGFFLFEAIEGNNIGDDYPVGYEKESIMGDYFRYLFPTNPSNIEIIPVELRDKIAVSDILDFNSDNFIKNKDVNVFFNRVYKVYEKQLG